MSRTEVQEFPEVYETFGVSSLKDQSVFMNVTYCTMATLYVQSHPSHLCLNWEKVYTIQNMSELVFGSHCEEFKWKQDKYKMEPGLYLSQWFFSLSIHFGQKGQTIFGQKIFGSKFLVKKIFW